MFTNQRKFLFGADPEVFFIREVEEERVPKDGTTELKRYFWCAEGLMPGTKSAPFKVPHGAIQVDGTAAEFNIDPVDNEKHFLRNVKSVLRYLKHNVAKPQGLKLAVCPVATFEEKYYHTLSREAKELGCNPDWNAYTGKLNPTPKAPETYYRTGAGHIHIGWGKNFKVNDPNLLEACCHVVKHLDTCLGKPLAKAIQYLPKDKHYLAYMESRRRSLYGDFGAFRPTTYGVEYRTPSNMWLAYPELVNYTFRQTCLAVEKSFSSTKYDYKVEQVGRL